MSDRSTTADLPPGRTFLRRNAVLIGVTTALVTLGAYVHAALEQPVYTAHARVLVEPLTVPTAVVRTPDMGTEEAIATSTTVLARAAATLHVSLSVVNHAAAATVPPDADVIDIGYTSSDREAARNGANAVAQAYMAYRVKTNPRTTGPGVADTLAAPGVQTRLVTPAARPASPSSPDLIVNVLAGLLVGLIAGVALAFAVDRFAGRIRSIARWQELTGVPVLVALQPETMVDAPSAGHARSPGADVLRYLRARVAQALPSRGAVLLVTEVREQPERRALARYLAGAFLDSGSSAVLVELMRKRPDHPGRPTPGELRVRVTVALGPECGLPPAGDWCATTVSELLALLDRYRAGHDVVVVTAPTVSVLVTSLDVAAVADAALLVDHVATARRDEATRAIAEIQSTGCSVCGCVLLGFRRSRVGDAATAETRPRIVSAPPREREPAQRRLMTTVSVTPIAEPARAAVTAGDSVNGSPT